MKASVYYGVQFAQSQLLLLSQAGRRAEIDRLVCRGAEVSLQDVTAEADWRNDVPATQFIEPDASGAVVRGYWTTFGAVISGGDWSDSPTPMLRYVVGVYENRFALEDGVWKFQRLAWRPLVETTPWPLQRDPLLERHLADPRSWVEMPSGLRAVSDVGVSQKTSITLELRNSLMGFCHRYNAHGVSAVDSAGISVPAATAARAMLAPAEGEVSGFLLATSPVVSVQANGLAAKVFASVTFLHRLGGKKIEHQRGSMLMGFTRSSEESSWLIEEFQWYRYATLQPWTIA